MTMLDELRLFLEVADSGSFSRTAQARGVAVSSVSRKMDVLEAGIGSKLFRRTSRAITLTDAGEQFVPRARNILAEMDEAQVAMSALRADPSGLLTVTAPSAFGRRHVAPAVFSFLQRYPLIEIDLHVSDDILDLAAKRVDIAIRIGVLPDSDLVATRLAPMQRIACASPAYLARCGTPATPEDLLHHNCLTVAGAVTPTGWWTFAGLHKNKDLPVRGSLRSDDTETLLNAAIAGLGVVHLASWLVSDAIAAGKLVQLFPVDLPALHKSSIAVHAVRMPGRSHAAKAQLFIDHLRGAFGAPTYWDRAIDDSTSPSR